MTGDESMLQTKTPPPGNRGPATLDHLAGRDILAVDLDGTLLRSDMLHESFWSATGRDWRTPFRAARTLAHSRAALKRRLWADADVDLTTLPYDQRVIERIVQWRDDGGAAVPPR